MGTIRWAGARGVRAELRTGFPEVGAREGLPSGAPTQLLSQAAVESRWQKDSALHRRELDKLAKRQLDRARHVALGERMEPRPVRRARGGRARKSDLPKDALSRESGRPPLP